ncbi:MAG: hypothetical protein FWD36_03415 [Treponema sp.]|nr:hypothetical protein [Treponema sp.]
MKKLGLVLAVVFLVMGMASAQSREKSQGAARPITVNGTLQLHNGAIAVADGSTVYVVPRLGRYIGFIDGLKEGNSVTIEGYVSQNLVHPSKVTIAGKSYDFPAARPDMGYAPGPGNDRGAYQKRNKRGHNDRNAYQKGGKRGNSGRSCCGKCRR